MTHTHLVSVDSHPAEFPCADPNCDTTLRERLEALLGDKSALDTWCCTDHVEQRLRDAVGARPVYLRADAGTPGVLRRDGY